MLPGNSPVFIRAGRPHNELFAGELEYALEVFANKRPHQCAFDMISEIVSRFVDPVCTEGGFISALRVLRSRRRSSCLWVPVHHLDRHVAVARANEQPGTISPVSFTICALLFEPSQPPRSHEPPPDAVISIAILAAGQRHCSYSDKRNGDERNPDNQ